MVSKFIVGSFNGVDGAAGAVASTATAAEAAERFGADIRAARADGRDGSQILDVQDLRDALEADGVLRSTDGDLLDWRDVSLADGDEIVFQSDVVDDGTTAGDVPECVHWQVESAGGGWDLRRTVRKYTVGCVGPSHGGTVYEDERMTPRTNIVPRPGAAGQRPLFRYVVANTAGAGCTNSVVNGPLGSPARNRIVSIRINFDSLIARRASASGSSLGTEISMRSRSNSDYQYAMGCEQ
jgi:hypothetical protein